MNSLREPWEPDKKGVLTLKGFANHQTLSGFRGFLEFITQGCRWSWRSNPGLELANAFGVF
jgi:hypothetical protein